MVLVCQWRESQRGDRLSQDKWGTGVQPSIRKRSVMRTEDAVREKISGAKALCGELREKETVCLPRSRDCKGPEAERELGS